MNAKTVFKVEDLTKTYQTGDVDIHALRGASATLYEGELSVMLGPSGSGKSTFLNIIGGLDTATSGQVLFKNTNLSKASEHELTISGATMWALFSSSTISFPALWRLRT